MRPKKRILLVDHDDYRASLTSFRLRIRGFAAFPARSAAEAEDLFDDMFPDVVVAQSDLPGLAALLDRLHERATVPQLVLAPAGAARSVTCDSFLADPTAEAMLEQVRVMAARKRGPKKNVHRATVDDLAAVRIA